MPIAAAHDVSAPAATSAIALRLAFEDELNIGILPAPRRGRSRGEGGADAVPPREDPGARVLPRPSAPTTASIYDSGFSKRRLRTERRRVSPAPSAPRASAPRPAAWPAAPRARRSA